MQINFEITGLEEMVHRLDALGAQSNNTRRRMLRAGIRVAERYAKEKAPVDMGNLKNSIHVERVTSQEAVLTASAEYAAYVEYGTRRMRARPYIRPAVEDHVEEIADVMTRVVDEALDGR